MNPEKVACHFLPHAQTLTTAPGRVNLLGEHVDYNGGPVLPAAIQPAVVLSAAHRNDRMVNLMALDLGKSTTFDLDALDEKVDIQGNPLPSWAWYPAGVAWVACSQGLHLDGMDAVYRSDLPIGAGLSSSAAVEVAFASTWQHYEGWNLSRMQLAQLCQKAENQYVGVNSGLMDQFAIAHGLENHALYFDTRSYHWEAVPLPEEIRLVIIDSGVRRALTTSAYNQRRFECEQALHILKQELPGIQVLRDVSIQDFSRLASRLPETVRMRARHVVRECNRVEKALEFLKNGDIKAFGRLMIEGHASLRDDYQVSLPVLDALVEAAIQQPGCLGARLTGAGFGGCTINLVECNQLEAFCYNMSGLVYQGNRLPVQIIHTRAADGARVQSLM